MIRALVAAAVLSCLAPRLSAQEDLSVPPFVGEARGRLKARAAAGAPRSEGKVWLTLDAADLAALSDAGAAGAAEAAGAGVAVVPIDAADLPAVAALAHERFHRCPGFMTHETRAEALEELAPRRGGSAFAYTVDQAAAVKPLVARVSESELRATIESLSARHDRYYMSGEGVASALWLRDRWEELARTIPGAKVETIVHARWKQPSVRLTIPGADRPDEIVVLGGHLDSINLRERGGVAPGADDNASGIAVLTEAVRLMAEGRFRPARTVQVIGYAAEEEGLLGSQDVARGYKKSGKNVVAVIQFDMTNYAGSGEKMFLLEDHVDPGLTAFLGKLIDAYVGLPWETMSCGYACSDHASWDSQGYPASCAFESRMGDDDPMIHTPGDTLATCGGTAAHSVPFAKLAAAFAAEAAKPAGSTGAGALARLTAPPLPAIMRMTP